MTPRGRFGVSGCCVDDGDGGGVGGAVGEDCCAAAWVKDSPAKTMTMRTFCKQFIILGAGAGSCGCIIVFGRLLCAGKE